MHVSKILLVGLLIGVAILWLGRGRSNPAANSDGLRAGSTAGAGARSQATVAPQKVSPRGLPSFRSAPAPTPFHALADSINPTSQHTRSTLTNLCVMTLISDLLLAHPELSDADLVTAVAGMGIPEELIRERLAGYPRGEASLAEIYTRADQIPALSAVRVAAERCGLPSDTSSDCLLDCFRFVAGTGELVDFLGTIRSTLAASPDFPGLAAEADRLGREQVEARDVFDRAYRERFLLRHGLTEAQTEALLGELKALQAPAATVDELYLPRRSPNP
jgi:hypothetical protein